MRLVEGAEGAVYRVEDRPLPEWNGRSRLYRCRDEQGVTRLYKEYPASSGADSAYAAVEELCARGRVLVADAQRHGGVDGTPMSSIAWPLDLTREARGGVSGVVIAPAPHSFYAGDGSLRTFDRLARPWDGTVVTAADRVGILIRLCEILRYCESIGLVHGAVAAEHIAWRGAAPGVHLIGCDRMRPAGAAAPPPRGMASAWRDPRLATESIAVPDQRSDRYGLALALYTGLFLNAPPQYRPGDAWTAPAGLPDGLAPRLRDLFTRALGDPLDAEARPDAQQWFDALVATYLDAADYRADEMAKLDDHIRRRTREARERPAPAGVPRVESPAHPGFVSPLGGAAAPTAGSSPSKPDSSAGPATAPKAPKAPSPPRPSLPPRPAPVPVGAESVAPVSGRPRFIPPPPARPGPSGGSLAARRRARRAWVVGGALAAAILLISIALAARPSASTAAPPDGGYPGYGQQGSTTAWDPGDTAQPTGTDTSSSGGDETAPATAGTGDAAAQAQAVSQLLAQSGQDRGLIANAVENELGGCQNIAQGVTDLNQGAADRGQEYQQAQQLQVDALTGGDQLKQDLLAALSASQQADQAYARWGSALDPASCVAPAPQNADFSAGDDASRQATAAKTQFISLWRPIADDYGLPIPDQSAI